jgi:FixJ family two-component response regulator
MKRLVRSFGMEAETFDSGREFLALLETRPSFKPDCVVLDVQMPGMTGLELQQRLVRTKLPLVFITAHDDAGVRERAMAAGAIAFLCKPFNDELLIGTLREALKMRAGC